MLLQFFFNDNLNNKIIEPLVVKIPSFGNFPEILIFSIVFLPSYVKRSTRSRKRFSMVSIKKI